MFGFLAALKRLRGTRFDVFGRSNERRGERQLISDYEEAIEEILSGLSTANHAAAVDLAALPLEIRGFGHVKEATIASAKARETSLRARFRSPALQAIAAE